MTLTVETLRSEVRALYQNLGANTMSDETLDRCIVGGLWRLSEDRPNELEYQLTGSGEQFNIGSLIATWVKDFSAVRQVWLPIPTTSLNNAQPLNDKQYRQFPIGSTDYLYISGGVGSGGALVIYTTPWRIMAIDGAASTTVPEPLEMALINICAAKAGLAMAARAAGSSDKSMPADFVNIGSTKSDQYRRVAREFEKDYLAALKLAHDRPKGIAVLRTYTRSNENEDPYLTHRSFGGRQW